MQRTFRWLVVELPEVELWRRCIGSSGKARDSSETKKKVSARHGGTAIERFALEVSGHRGIMLFLVIHNSLRVRVMTDSLLHSAGCDRWLSTARSVLEWKEIASALKLHVAN